MNQHVSFAVAKRVVTIPDVFKACGVDCSQFAKKDGRWRGICPLPSHPTSSHRNPQQFVADDKKGYWLFRCFSDCDVGGDSVDLAKRLTGLDDKHIRRWLIEHFGSRLSLSKADHRGEKRETTTKKADEDFDSEQVNQASSPTKSTCSLPPRPSDLKSLKWKYNLDGDCPYLLEQRRLSPTTITRFELGLCGKGWLNGHIAIPLYWHDQGDDELPISYLGRFNGERDKWDDQTSKYRFWSGFPRRKYVYGVREAVRDSSPNSPIVVVEGAFDLYRIVQEIELPNVVATLGAGLSDEQAELLTSLGRPLVLMFDGNAQLAMRRAAAKLIRHAFVRVVTLEDGVEPDHLDADQLREHLHFMC